MVWEEVGRDGMGWLVWVGLVWVIKDWCGWVELLMVGLVWLGWVVKGWCGLVMVIGLGWVF